MKLHNIIIDTDPGIDDALAIGLALYSPKINVKLITTVHGNVSLEKTTYNACVLREFFNVDTPIAVGESKPLLRGQEGCLAHGISGMDGYIFNAPEKKVLAIPAVEAIRELLVNSEVPIKLVAMGPLTNIAILIQTYPEIEENIDELVIMGGSLVGGNITEHAEFNFWADPHAAKLVMDSSIRKTVVGLDVTSQALVTDKELLAGKNKSSGMFKKTFKYYDDGNLIEGVWMHDSCTIALLCEKDIFTFEDKTVDIVVSGASEGAMIEREDGAIISYAVAIDSDKFKSWVVSVLKHLP
ncbi:TPA: nucleoside hydrolase [Serratia marcescens]|nr:nucleoside hydrolase [Serratia marcescens]